MSRCLPVTILIAEDDPDDRLLTREAFSESRPANRVDFVHDGEELLDYLNHRPPYDDSQRYPRPGLILLDLNMPRMDGREALRALKAEPRLRDIPVVMLSTSCDEEDIRRSYADGVNSFISKPASFNGLLDVVRSLGDYCLETIE
ncbi:Response regulator receiver domain-containing protein [Pseudomonas linyingensis]|jgi:two-component system response regulator|uniref:Response regulator receiver domain-containing protein n=1 Tax=Pseudomonas linyingensis TaxID=915471 RepID=A0A1H6Z885_9PSED|nr:response regulator [Pseudomonas linyingensis]SEJ47637.1 Response regulator receiver domain-containing protein [Pseudomonas linyingensis]